MHNLSAPRLAPLGATGLQLPQRIISTNMGSAASVDEAIAFRTMRRAIDAGYIFIDTDNLASLGLGESFVGNLIAGYPRDSLFLSTRVSPAEATRDRLRAVVCAALRRITGDYIDLLSLHWRGAVDLNEHVEAMKCVCAEGLARYVGVSHFSADDLNLILDIDPNLHFVANRVLYNINDRGVERGRLPRYCYEKHISLIGYDSLNCKINGRYSSDLVSIARTFGVSESAVALAFVTRFRNAFASVSPVDDASLGALFASENVVLDAANVERLSGASAAGEVALQGAKKIGWP